MSYDIRIVIDTGGDEPAWIDGCYWTPTDNLSNAFRRILARAGVPEDGPEGGLYALDMMLAGLAAQFLRAAINLGRENDDNPDAIEVLDEVMRKCLTHPKATLATR